MPDCPKIDCCPPLIYGYQPSFEATATFTALCPVGQTGDPVVVTRSATSLISKQDAYNTALAQATSDAQALLICGNPDLNPFDYAVLRFLWEPEEGSDLDVRVSLLNVAPEYDGVKVGWCEGNQVGPDDPFYLQWGGDNTGSEGPEAVLVNFKRMGEDYPDKVTISAQTYCNWYASRGTGDFTLQFETYLGGTMQQDGYDFVNVGGVLVQQINRVFNVESQDSACIDGSFVCNLTYDLATKTAFINE